MARGNQSSESAPPSAAAGPSYEFTEDQNRLIADLVKRMRLVGIFMLVLGGAVLVAFVVQLVTTGEGASWVGLPIGLFLFLTGLWTLRSEVSFRRIVDTEGRDITHVVRAMAELRKFYALQYWLVVICLLLFLVSLVAQPAGIV